MIELVPQVGDYVVRGDPLFRIRTGGRPMVEHLLKVLPNPDKAALQEELSLLQREILGIVVLPASV